ncbi:uncharacterized protein LOC131951389 [Physella acuta]|uniref:uncharacterized protein LOC131951389 n=1 Tax=Physella acuta TaxID=109671 RepID=UPI0027DB7EAC|nr:uncharacterized protein LOC131951389 [Physella acuta]
MPCVMLVSAAVYAVARAECDPDIPSRQLPPQGNPQALSSSPPLTCGAGVYKDTSSHTCRPCPEGTFMTTKMASLEYEMCETCLQPNSNERVEEKCSATRDTNILCLDGLYRSAGTDRCDWECRNCDVCGLGSQQYLNYEKRKCSGFNNTVCCKYDDMEVINDRCVPVTTPPTTQHVTSQTGRSQITSPKPTTTPIPVGFKRNKGTRVSPPLYFTLTVLIMSLVRFVI